MIGEMSSHQVVLRRKWLEHFVKVDIGSRDEVLQKYGIEPLIFAQAVEERYTNDLITEDDDGNLDAVLSKIRREMAPPRIGKKGKIFLMRHYEVSKRLLDKGATYNEIAYFLEKQRRFKVTAGYLQKLMERCGDV